MQLMKNNFLKFDNIDFQGFAVKNITSLNSLPEIPSKFKTSEYYLEYEVADGTLIEAISQDIYQSTHYWDLLLVLNDITSMSALPVKYDTVLKRADEELAKWLKKGILMGNILTDDMKEQKYLEILEIEKNKNEKYRIIKYIPIDRLSELESDLAKAQEEISIDPALLIKKED